MKEFNRRTGVRLRRRCNGDPDAGFTLIELMVVILIIAILMAIAIPTYLGARNRAENRAAQSDLRTTLSALNVFYGKRSSYNGLSATALAAIEPALSYTNPVSSPNQVAVQALGSQAAIATDKSQSGRCFWLMSVESSSSRQIGSSYFNSETVTGPGTWYANTAPAGPGGSCDQGLGSPNLWSKSTSVGWS